MTIRKIICLAALSLIMMAGCGAGENLELRDVDKIEIYYRSMASMSPLQYTTNDLRRVENIKKNITDEAKIAEFVAAVPAVCRPDQTMSVDHVDPYLLLVASKNGQAQWEMVASKFHYVLSTDSSRVCHLSKSDRSELVSLSEGRQ